MRTRSGTGSLLLEVTVEQAFEAAAVASFVASHFMNCIVDSIQVQFLSTLSNTGLVSASTAFSVHTLFEVGLRIPNHVTEQFSKLSSVFSFFPCVTLESFSNFGITFAVCLTAHSQVHTNFGAFAREVCIEVLNHFFVAAFSHTYFVFSYEVQTLALNEFFEFRGRNATLRTFFGSVFTFVYIAANGANEFLFHNEFVFFELLCFLLFIIVMGVACQPERISQSPLQYICCTNL